MRYLVWIVALGAAFSAGKWLVPAASGSQSVARKATQGSSEPLKQSQTDSVLVRNQARIERRLQALDERLIAAGDAASQQDPVPPAQSREDRAAKHRALLAARQNAPPARDTVDLALRRGSVTREDVDAFHHRLNELPVEEQQALLQEFQTAINTGKVRLEF